MKIQNQNNPPPFAIEPPAFARTKIILSDTVATRIGKDQLVFAGWLKHETALRKTVVVIARETPRLFFEGYCFELVEIGSVGIDHYYQIIDETQ